MPVAAKHEGDDMTKKLLLNAMMAGLLATSQPGWGASGGEIGSTSADQQGVAVTIYNDNLALVKDARRVGLARDFNRLAWREVSAQMRPETAQLRNVSSPAGFRLLEQNFDFDLLTPQKLLEKYIGREVGVIRTHPASGAETRETAKVLAANGGVVLKFADRIETGVPGRLAFAGVPDTLRDKPTLVISLNSSSAGVQDSGIVLSDRGCRAAIMSPSSMPLTTGWISTVGDVTNQSGAAYPKPNCTGGGVLNGCATPAGAARDNGDGSENGRAARCSRILSNITSTRCKSTTLAENLTKQVALMWPAGYREETFCS